MVFGFKNKRVDSAPPDNMKDKDGENNAEDKSEKKGLWGRLKSGL